MTKDVVAAWYRQPVTLAGGLLVIVCALLELGGDETREALRYLRSGIFAGEWWRLVTGHLVHLGPAHMLLNSAALAMLTWLFANDLRAWQWLVILLCSVAAIDIGFLLWEPQLEWYVGLSGVLHGLFAAAALARCWRRERDGYWLLAGLILKLLWEQTFGPTPFTAESSGGPVVVNAHLYGALGGAAATLIALFTATRTTPDA